MKIKVKLTAFNTNEIRTVEIPDREYKDDYDILETVYYYGQNDIQKQNTRSVSMDDIIVIDNNEYKVDLIGFTKLKG